MTNKDIISHAALVPILDGLFDYAGLFPPAALDMDAAAKEYLGHKSGPEHVMVGPFVVPAARLADMQRAFEAHGAGTDFALLPRSVDAAAPNTHAGATSAATERLLHEDFSAARHLEEQADQPFRCIAVESRIPVPMVDAAQYASLVGIALDKTGLTPDRVFLEIPRGNDYQARLTPYFEALGSLSGTPLFAGKLRCGGPAPEDHPSSREVAQFILAGVRTRCPFKFTAGLHHPFRHMDSRLGTAVHGFVNVMFATAVAATWDETNATDPSGTMEEILEEYTPRMFRCIGEEIRWKHFRITPDAFRRVRSELALGIGSCSINEPIEDLSHYFPPAHT